MPSVRELVKGGLETECGATCLIWMDILGTGLGLQALGGPWVLSAPLATAVAFCLATLNVNFVSLQKPDEVKEIE